MGFRRLAARALSWSGWGGWGGSLSLAYSETTVHTGTWVGLLSSMTQRTGCRPQLGRDVRSLVLLLQL